MCLYVCVQLLSPIRFCNPMPCSLPGSSVHEISQAKNTGMGCYFLLQDIILIQGSNPCPLCLLTPAGGFFTTAPPGKPQLYPHSPILYSKDAKGYMRS